MVPAFNPMACPKLAVPAEVMRHVVQVESSANPFAIGVVGARLQRQPRNLGEAVATARMLESKGYDYSLGVAQINRSNLARYGLDTLPKAFDGCANLVAGARILAECYGRSGADWGKALSCYYSGDFTTGYREGYVQRVYGAIQADAAEPIIVHPQSRDRAGQTTGPAQRPVRPGTAAYRVSMRSMALDAAVGRPVPTIAQAAASPAAGNTVPSSRPISGTAAPETLASLGGAFVPRVSGLDDGPVAPVADVRPASSGRSAASAVPGRASPDPDTADAAFVF